MKTKLKTYSVSVDRVNAYRCDTIKTKAKNATEAKRKVWNIFKKRLHKSQYVVEAEIVVR